MFGSTGSEWGEVGEEEVETREWVKVHSTLTEVRVQLTREARMHSGCMHVVWGGVGWDGGLQGTEADVTQGRVADVHNYTCTRRDSRQAGGRGRWHWLDGTTEKVRATKTRRRTSSLTPGAGKEKRAADITKEESSYTRQANERNDCSRSGHEDHDQHQDLEEEKRRALAAQREILRTCNFQANRQPTRQGTTVTGTGAFTFASQVFRNTCKARRACFRIDRCSNSQQIFFVTWELAAALFICGALDQSGS